VKIICCTLFVFLISSSVSFGQIQNKLWNPFGDENHVFVNIGYSQWKYGFGEIGIGSGSGFDDVDGILTLSGLYLGSEFKLNASNFILGPKLQYSITMVLTNVGLNCIYYTDFKYGEFYLRPQIGIGLGRFFDLTYGYNFPISGDRMASEVNDHTVSLIIHLKTTWEFPNFHLPRRGRNKMNEPYGPWRWID